MSAGPAGGPRHVVDGGLRIAYRTAGQGPPVLLLHGGISDGREWRPMVERLAGDHTLVAWDAPGCGASSDPPAGYRLGDYADRLAGLARALGLGRPHVVGLSFGAGLALELARRHPGLPASLVLVSGYAGWAGSLPPEEVRERLDRALADAERPAAEWAPEWIPELFTDAAPRELVEELTAIAAESRPAGIRAMARAFAEADLRDALPGIGVPTLILSGEGDVRSPPHVARALHERIRGSRLVTIPGAGHMLTVDAPDAVAAELRAFLRSAGLASR